ncbi:zinc-dependent peptidase [Granulosicoccus antarcticus]|uniref:Protein MtfA n=1 Tax=Granulosicoccus antarcticus IMCC3135 TaxID=1192854 RepID=A0A2Z2P5J3_9GAMM|nr:M90 family metallopeptidase [Granulosicoccus antarcticus]ASJ75967.1 Protein MtfA [Granulosicoccus antarcticus IMCC3135]
MPWYKDLFRGRRVVDPPVTEQLWQQIVARSPAVLHLDRDALARLKLAAERFLQTKSFEAARGMVLDDGIRLQIALHACLLTLDLPHLDYRALHSIIVYPDAFLSPHRHIDQAGVVHAGGRTLAGEAWLNGPVVLAWSDVLQPRPGGNVILHEFAHKLDGVNGVVNGFPPMPPNLSSRQWSLDLQSAFDTLNWQLDRGLPAAIDAYAATSPAEFFAVCSEYFFEAPGQLHAVFPEVYEQLEQFFGQRTLRHHSAGSAPAWRLHS